MSTDYPYSDVQFAKVRGGGTALQTTLDTIEAGRVGKKIELISVKLHLDGTGTTSENFTIKENAGDGTSYDVLVHSQDMNGETDDIFLPLKPYPVDKNTDLDGSYQNSGSRNWGLEFGYREIF